MPYPVPLEQTAQATVNTAGQASIIFGPSTIGELWHVALVTATSGGLGITVTRNASIVIDSTSGDPRATVTTDSAYDLARGEFIEVAWTGGSPGATVVATIHGTREWPDLGL